MILITRKDKEKNEVRGNVENKIPTFAEFNLIESLDGKGKVVIYQLKDGSTSIDVKLENETLWINRQQMAELFDRDIKTIGKQFRIWSNKVLKDYLFSPFILFTFSETDCSKSIQGEDK